MAQGFPRLGTGSTKLLRLEGMFADLKLQIIPDEKYSGEHILYVYIIVPSGDEYDSSYSTLKLTVYPKSDSKSTTTARTKSTTTTTPEKSSNEGLVKGDYWTYVTNFKSELKGKGNYDGTIIETERAEAHSTVIEATSSTLIIKDIMERNITVDGTGYFEHYDNSLTTLIRTYTIDRQTLTYRSLKSGNGTHEWEDTSVVGLPVFEFVSTSLKDGQEVKHYFLGKEIKCSVVHREIDHQGEKLPVITLYCSSSTNQDYLLETTGTADGILDFEKNTGLLVSFSITQHAVSEKGSRSILEIYNLNSTSLWTKKVSISTTAASILSPTTSIIPTETESPSPAITLTSSGIWLGPFLVAIGLVVGVSIFISRRRKSSIEPKQETVLTEKITSAERMEYCFHCGAAMPIGSKFCKKCGKTQV